MADCAWFCVVAVEGTLDSVVSVFGESSSIGRSGEHYNCSSVSLCATSHSVSLVISTTERKRVVRLSARYTDLL
jgi:hypothetical protein